ncbi:MAG: hypothetical protein WC091_26020 [Sulfuricellaceae bacterium]
MYSIPSKPNHAFNFPSFALLPMAKRFFQGLDRLLTAMAYAEAGDLDAVKALLEQNREKSRRAS